MHYLYDERYCSGIGHTSCTSRALFAVHATSFFLRFATLDGTFLIFYSYI